MNTLIFPHTSYWEHTLHTYGLKTWSVFGTELCDLEDSKRLKWPVFRRTVAGLCCCSQRQMLAATGLRQSVSKCHRRCQRATDCNMVHGSNRPNEWMCFARGSLCDYHPLQSAPVIKTPLNNGVKMNTGGTLEASGMVWKWCLLQSAQLSALSVPCYKADRRDCRQTKDTTAQRIATTPTRSLLQKLFSPGVMIFFFFWEKETRIKYVLSRNFKFEKKKIYQWGWFRYTGF